MSKIIVRRQEYANNGTHANEIESVVKDNLIVNTLSSAMDVAPSVGLLKSLSDNLGEYKKAAWTATQSNAYAQILSDALTDLSVGTYIVFGSVPISDNSAGLIYIAGSGITIRGGGYYQTGSSQKLFDVMQVDSASNSVIIRSASSATINYSYLDRGFLAALRLK